MKISQKSSSDATKSTLTRCTSACIARSLKRATERTKGMRERADFYRFVGCDVSTSNQRSALSNITSISPKVTREREKKKEKENRDKNGYL